MQLQAAREMPEKSCRIFFFQELFIRRLKDFLDDNF